MLAALRFLAQYMKQYNVIPACPEKQHKEYTDSESLLKRLRSSKSWFYPSPKACMASEFDLEITISNTLEELPLNIELHHVKSHQDKPQPTLIRLSWEARLNVLCDRLATQQLSFCPLGTTVDQNPYCNAYVCSGDDSVTGHVRKSLFCAASQPIIRDYLLDRHKCGPPRFATQSAGKPTMLHSNP
jgi:hypothetical protein